MDKGGVDLENVPIDRGWAWMALFGAAVSSFFFVGGIRSLGILLVEVVTRFQATSATASLILAIVSVGLSIVAPMSTSMGERFTFRLVIVIGGVLCALGSFLTSFATNATFIIIVYGTLTGIGFGCIAGPSLVVVGHYFNKRRALANGLAVSGGSVGQLIIPLLMRFLLDEYGFRGGLMIYSAISLNVVPAALLMRPFSFYSLKKKPSHYTQTRDAVEVVTYAASAPLGNGTQLLQPEKGNETMIFEDGIELTDFSKKPRNEDNLGDTCCADAQNTQDCNNGGKSLNTENETINKSPDELSLSDSEVRFQLHYPSSASIDKRAALSENVLATEKDSLALPPHNSPSQDNSMELGVPLRNNPSRVPTAQRQTSTLSWISVRSLEVAPHQEIPDASIAGPAQTDGIQCPRDFKTNCCCCFVPNTQSEASQPLIPWYLLKDPLFILYTVAICLGNSGYINAGLFFPAHAEYDVGMTRASATLLLSIIGVMDLIGRIGGGWFADLGFIRRSRILSGCLFLTGVAVFVCIPIQSQPALIGMSVVMGVIGGCCISMQTVVLVDFFGAEKLSATCGLSIMFQGLINIFVPSLLGIVRDVTGTYNLSYYICAALMVLSAVIFTFEDCARKKQQKQH